MFFLVSCEQKDEFINQSLEEIKDKLQEQCRCETRGAEGATDCASIDLTFPSKFMECATPH